MNPIVAVAWFCSLSVCVVPAFVTGRTPQDPAKDSPTYSGFVGDWYVTVPGRVQFQIVDSGRDRKDGKQPDLWFETPPDRDLNTLYEDLVLSVILHAREKGLPIVVESKRSSGDDGTTAAKAFDIVRIGVSRT